MATEPLDPAFSAVIDERFDGDVPAWHTLGVEEARRVEDEAFSSSGPAVASVTDMLLDGPDGDLPIRVYEPDVAAPPALVFYHGGGWVMGTLDSADDICRRLASRAGCLVASVDYRLAPEHPFPAALDDATSALQWVAHHADVLGAAPDRLGVAGTSAGGNLAAATALRTRDSFVDLDAQFLLYPMVDYDFQRPSYREHADGPLLTRADVEWFWQQYLHSPPDAKNPYTAVLRTDDLSGVPPAAVFTAGHDVLRDEGAAYAAHLDVAGVDVAREHYPALPHGFLSFTDEVPAADAALDDLAAHVKRLL